MAGTSPGMTQVLGPDAFFRENNPMHSREVIDFTKILLPSPGGGGSAHRERSDMGAGVG